MPTPATGDAGAARQSIKFQHYQDTASARSPQPRSSLRSDLRNAYADCLRQATWPDAQNLHRLGVTPQAINRADGVGAGRVRFEANGTFCFTDDGTRALILPVYGYDGIIDLVAFLPEQLDCFAANYGMTFCMGSYALTDKLCNDALTDRSPLLVYGNVMGWLRGGGDGICILRWQWCWDELRGVGDMHAMDLPTARKLEKAMQPPRWRGRVMVAA